MLRNEALKFWELTKNPKVLDPENAEGKEIKTKNKAILLQDCRFYFQSWIPMEFKTYWETVFLTFENATGEG